MKRITEESKPCEHEHSITVNDDQLDEEDIRNLINFVMILDEIERGLTPEQREEVFGSEDWRARCSGDPERV